MAWSFASNWSPMRVIDVGESADTSTGVVEVTTNAGKAYLKPMGNRQGPHVLATDWVGTHLAKWFGLSTFDIAILYLGDSDCFPLPRNNRAAPGPALASRAVKGFVWGESSGELDDVVNPDAVTRLV